MLLVSNLSYLLVGCYVLRLSDANPGVVGDRIRYQATMVVDVLGCYEEYGLQVVRGFIMG